MPHYHLHLTPDGPDDARDIVTIWMDRPTRVLTNLPLALAKRLVVAMNEAHAAGYAFGHTCALNEVKSALDRMQRDEAERAAELEQ